MNLDSFRKLTLEAQSQKQVGIIMWPNCRMMLRYAEEVFTGSPAYTDAMNAATNGDLVDLLLDYESSFGKFKAFIVPVDQVLCTTSLFRKAWEKCEKRGPISLFTTLPNCVTSVWR